MTESIGPLPDNKIVRTRSPIWKLGKQNPVAFSLLLRCTVQRQGFEEAKKSVDKMTALFDQNA